ncbi:MAG: hypothetical protein WCV91_01665 [Candidatus Margulisiibacteriota bacterium]
MVNQIGPRPTLVQRLIAPTVTWGLSHILTYPNRKAVAGSLRELAIGFTFEQRSELIHLLFVNGVIQTKFSSLSPEELQHYHIKKDLRLKTLRTFIYYFNRSDSFPEYKIHFIGAQFTLEKVEVKAPAAVPEIEVNATQPSLQISLHRIFYHANRPLSLRQIHAELSSPVEEGVPAIQASTEDISFFLGRMMEKGSILRTFPGTDDLPRFCASFLAKRWTNEGVLCPLSYSVEDGDHSAAIYRGDAEAHCRKGTLHKVLTIEGQLLYATPLYMLTHKDEYALLSTGKKEKATIIFCQAADIPVLVEKGKILLGRTDEGQEINILAEHQQAYRFEIFNIFAQEALHSVPETDQAATYQRLRVAFNAGYLAHAPTSIDAYISEARLVRGMGGGDNAITMALLGDKKGVAQLRKGTVFTPAEIEVLDRSFDALNLLTHLPFPYKPGFSHCLQNFLYFLYDASLNYDVYLLVLARKYEGMVKLSQTGGQIPESVALDMELVVAPQAKKRGFPFLHDEACDLLARQANPEGYQRASAQLQTLAQMPLDRAKSRLHQTVDSIKKRMVKELGFPISVKYRIKEVSSAMQKESIERAEFCDFFGGRFICSTLAEAKAVSAWLSNNLIPVGEADLPPGTKGVEDNLETPRKTGWKGWRGYFYVSDRDRISEGPIIASLQVLTTDMDKADRLGEYGHWLYKSVRASIKWAKELGARWKQQLFDPVPADAYSGIPSEDYRVDQERAQKYNTVFVLPLKAGDETPKDIQSLFAAGSPAILRPGRESPVYDLVAFRSFGNLMTESHICEVYTLSYSKTQGRIVAAPYKKGQARCGFKEKLPRHAFVIIREDPAGGKPLGDADLAEIVNNKSSSFRAVFLARLELERRKRNRGSVQMTHEVVIGSFSQVGIQNPAARRYFLTAQNGREKIQEALSRLGLKDEIELFAAIGLDLLGETKIKELLSIFDAREEHRAGNNNTYTTTVTAPNHRQLIPTTLSGLEQFDIMQLSLDVESRSLGVNPVKITILSKPKGTLVQYGQIKAKLDNLGSDPLFASPVHAADDPSVFYTIEVGLSTKTPIANWNTIHEITSAMQASFRKGGFVSVKLGNILEGESTGSFVFQVHGIDSPSATEKKISESVRESISPFWDAEEGRNFTVTVI